MAPGLFAASWPSTITAGPCSTSNVTGNPLLAVARSGVGSCKGIKAAAGATHVIVCSCGAAIATGAQKPTRMKPTAEKVRKERRLKMFFMPLQPPGRRILSNFRKFLRPEIGRFSSNY
jgi:hypothetical protein